MHTAWWHLSLLIMGSALVLAGCDGSQPDRLEDDDMPTDAELATFELSGHVRAVDQFGTVSLLDFPLGGGPDAAPATSCGLGDAEPYSPVYLQQGSFSIQGERFSLRLAGGRWMDGSNVQVEIGGDAVASAGTVWELYPDNAGVRYFAVFTPNGRGNDALTILTPPSQAPPGTTALANCHALRFSGPRVADTWASADELFELSSLARDFGDGTFESLPYTFGTVSGTFSLSAGQLTLTAGGSYTFSLTYQVGSGAPLTPTNEDRYATTGPFVIFDYDRPSISVGLRAAEELTVFDSQQPPLFEGSSFRFTEAASAP